MKRSSWKSLTAIMLIAASLCAAGCGLKDPSTNPPPQESSATKTNTATVPEHDGGESDQPSSDLPPTTTCRYSGKAENQARAAARKFAETYTNWDHNNLLAKTGVLRNITGGELQQNLKLRGEFIKDDQTIKRDRQAHRGTVLAINISPVKPGSGEWRGYVVLRETEIANGVTFSADVPTIYTATLQHTDGKWKIVKWEPVK